MEILTFILEMIGTVAFAVSGALVAVEKKMDVLGVVILGLTTAVGGGVLRDVILGNTPPAAFVSPVYMLTAVAVSIIVFIPAVRSAIRKNKERFDQCLLVMDSLGLSVFTVVGIDVALRCSASPNLLLLVFVGVVTGVGGGVMRDIMAGNTPFIFVKYFYASAAIVGALVSSLLRNVAGSIAAAVAGVVIIFVLRMLAARYRWKLPRA